MKFQYNYINFDYGKHGLNSNKKLYEPFIIYLLVSSLGDNLMDNKGVRI